MDGLNELGQTFGIWGTIALFIIYVTQQIIRDLIKAKKGKRERESLEEFKQYIYRHLDEISRVNSETLKYLKFSTLKYTDNVSESQARVVANYAFNMAQADIINYLTKISDENHIAGNEREISAKIRAFISNRFSKDALALKEFKFNGKEMSESLHEEWKDYTIEQALDITLKEKGHNVLVSTMTNAFDGFKMEYLGLLF